MVDKTKHAEGCVIQPHQGTCVVSDASLAGIGYAIVLEPVFVPLLTGDATHDQIRAALRVAPGSTALSPQYRWRHRKTNQITDRLDPRQDPNDWVREVCDYGQVWSAWQELTS